MKKNLKFVPILFAASIPLIMAPSLSSCKDKTFSVTLNESASKQGVYIKHSTLAVNKDSEIELGGIPAIRKISTAQIQIDGTEVPQEDINVVESMIYVKAAGIKNAGKVNLHVELTDQKILFEVKIKSLPEKTIFKAGEQFTAKGLVLHASYYDGSEEDITDGFTTSLPEGYVFSEQDIKDNYEITVKYGWKQTKYSVRVTEPTLEKITICQQAGQTIFKVGEGFYAFGLTINCHYSNGKVKEITEGFTLSYDNDKIFAAEDVGDRTVTISYKGHTAEYNIKVINVLLESVDIYQKPKKLEFKVGENFSSEGIKLKSNWSDGSEVTIKDPNYFQTKIGETVVTTETKFTADDVGHKQVEVAVKEDEGSPTRTTSYYIDVKPATLTSINVDEAKSTGLIKEFKVGEMFTSNGLVLEAHYSDGSTKEITTGFTTNWDGKQFKQVGEETVIVSYEGATCSYKITVKAATIVKLTISTPPSRQTFKKGEKFTSAGLSLSATYSDGTTKTIKSGFTTNPAEGSKLDNEGEFNVIVTFEGLTVSYAIKVTPATLTKIEIYHSATHKNFNVGETFDCDGLVLTATYSDGSTKYIAAGFTTNFDQHKFTEKDIGTKIVIVSYQNLTTFYEITIKASPLESIEILKQPTTTIYEAGQAFSTTGLTIKGHYQDGTWKEISSGFTTNPANGYVFKESDIKEQFNVKVAYSGKEASFNVKVIAATLVSITADATAARKEFKVGETFNRDGLKITATYSSGDPKVITEGFTTDYDGVQFTTDHLGTKPVTVTYQGKTTTYDITVVPAALERITIGTPAQKLTFKVGENFNCLGLVLIAHYSDGTSKSIDTGFNTDPSNDYKFKKEDLGVKTVKVKYTEGQITKETEYGISVTKATLESIQVKDGSAHKTSFRAGETFTSSGLKLEATYSDESKETISSGWTTSLDGQKFTREQIGKQITCLVHYQGKTTSYSVTVTKAGLEKLEFKSKPSKLTYKVGEKFTTEGMVLNATYSDGVTKEITSGWSTQPYIEGHKFNQDERKVDQDITVSYTEGGITLSVKYQINITDATLESISVKKLPKKTTFVAGDEFTCDDMELNCHYSDGSIKTAYGGFTTNFDKHKFTRDDVGNKTVIVTYHGKTTTYDIKVSPAVVTNVVVNYERSHLKVKYSPGQKFTSDGLVLTLTYSDGVTQDVTDGYTTNHDGYVFSKQDGTAPILITIKYKDFAPRIDGYYVWVLIPQTFKISPHSQHRTMFEIGEKFWHQGLKILVTNNDGSQYETSENIKSNIDGSIFEYGDKEMSIDITYSDITMYGIYKVNVNKPLFFEVHQRSSHRTKFKVGETFNHKGLVLLVTFTDHSIREVAEGFKTNLDGYKFNDMDRGKTKPVNIVLPDGEVFLYAIEVE